MHSWSIPRGIVSPSPYLGSLWNRFRKIWPLSNWGTTVLITRGCSWPCEESFTMWALQTSTLRMEPMLYFQAMMPVSISPRCPTINNCSISTGHTDLKEMKKTSSTTGSHASRQSIPLWVKSSRRPGSFEVWLQKVLRTNWFLFVKLTLLSNYYIFDSNK